MNIVFSDMPIPNSMKKSIFLAGPSPRSFDVHDWKKEAIEILEKIGFDGTVFLPVPKDKFYKGKDGENWTYYNQIQWEVSAREIADAIVFWVPRDIAGNMPGFTTNVEFGEDLHSNKIFYGRPDNAEKCRYLDERIKSKKQTIYSSLETMLLDVQKLLGDGALRQDGEIHVPLFVWRTKEFQSWYSSLVKNGNKLLNAKVKSCLKVGRDEQYLFSFGLWVDIWIEQEQRRKPNETVFFRPDISSVVAVHTNEENKTFVVLVEEFRSPVNNSLGRVLELPSGSSTTDENELENAQKEFSEETTLFIEDASRFKFISKRQMVSTFSSYKNSLYKVTLTEDEFKKLQTRQATQDPMGADQGDEKTFIRIISVDDLFNHDIDHSNIGMIYEAIQSKD